MAAINEFRGHKNGCTDPSRFQEGVGHFIEISISVVDGDDHGMPGGRRFLRTVGLGSGPELADGMVPSHVVKLASEFRFRQSGRIFARRISKSMIHQCPNVVLGQGPARGFKSGQVQQNMP